MSALAARRAAALKESQPASEASTPTPARTPPSPQEEDVLSDADSESEETELPRAVSPPYSKRRKLAAPSGSKGPAAGSAGKTPPLAKVQGRYFAVAPPKKERRFSPSAPAESDAETSATGSDDVLSEDEYEEARDDVDEGRAQWSAPTTPAAGQITPGPGPSRNRSRLRTTVNAGLGQSTSNFTPADGVNIHRVSEDQLQAAGLDDGYSGPGVVLSLQSDESLVLAGTYVLTILSGHVSIASTTLSPGTSFPVFSPTSHPVPSITPVQSPSAVHWLGNLKLPKGFNREGAVFLVRENICGIDGLRYGAVPGFAHIWLEEQGPWGLRGVHPVIGSFASPIYPHVTPPTWTSALSALPTSSHNQDSDLFEVSEPFVALVKGPKRSGKSTFARTLLNNLLERYERVAWLECDLGQGEFGSGGVVGLWVLDKQVIGPSFTHPLVPVRAHYLGTYTPLTCPDEYIASLNNLVEHYKYELQHPAPSSPSSDEGKRGDIVPLVINTQGWVKGLGEELLRGIEGMTQPTHVYAFESPEDEVRHGAPGWTNSPTWQNTELPDLYGHSLSTEKTARNYVLEPAPVSPLQARFTPADLRVLSTLSYFHSALRPLPAPSSSSSLVPRWDFETPLLAQLPVKVAYGNGPIRHVYLIGEGSDGVVPEDLDLALNGAVVALVELELEPEGGVYEQGRLPPVETNFLGLGVVRSISSSGVGAGVQGTLHLLTPLPLSVLSRCNGIIKNGAIELPTPGFVDFINPSSVFGAGEAGEGLGQVPFFDVGGVEVVGGERRRFRKNIMRKGM